jgi:hypothetical protein
LETLQYTPVSRRAAAAAAAGGNGGPVSGLAGGRGGRLPARSARRRQIPGEPAERVPHLERLRRRAFGVAVADHDQHRRLHLLDEIDRRAFGVDRRIVVGQPTLKIDAMTVGGTAS